MTRHTLFTADFIEVTFDAHVMMPWYLRWLHVDRPDWHGKARVYVDAISGATVDVSVSTSQMPSIRVSA